MDTRLGDQLAHFMERAIRDCDYVLVVCTPRYKSRSDSRQGGVGYEGHIITSELLTLGNERKFLPILRGDQWTESAPSWALGKRHVDLRGDPYLEPEYRYLLQTLLGALPHAPSIEPNPTSARIQHLDSLAVTDHQKYADLVNASIKAYEAATNRLILSSNDSLAASQMLPRVEADLTETAAKVASLAHEMNLLSSTPVGEAAREIAGQVQMMKATSLAKQGAVLEGLFRSLVDTSIPKFRDAVRRELSVRRGEG